jgi:hypothetical protein
MRHSKLFFVDTSRETAKIARDLPSARIVVVLMVLVPFARQAGVLFCRLAGLMVGSVKSGEPRQARY